MKRILSFFLILLSLTVTAQTDNTAEKSYTEYFKLPRETIFLHLNKTTFLPGEEIWFKGYAYDQKNQLSSKATTNFNIGIYDTNGKQVRKRLFKGEKGVTHGSFIIDPTLVSGTYYIKASTNWMKNFKDEGAFIQKIEIVGTAKDKNKTETVEASYDFQFLPEGGHIVADTKNSIGFKVIDSNGKGIAASGVVYNVQNEEVATFKSNALGLGKFLLNPISNQQYTAIITLDSGKKINKKLPFSKNRGISIIVNNPFPDKVVITLNTNSATIANNGNSKYKLLIHQNGKLKTVLFSFDGKTEKNISIPKKELFKGINTITLFDVNETPILERLFFNTYAIKEASITAAKLNKVQDSVLLSVKELGLTSNANVSISILPEETESYNPSSNIISNFYLKPYLKSTIENPQYYFEKLDRRRMYELDILLLTQGWSKYNWNAIFKDPPSDLNPFENGITIKGTVNKPSSGINKLFLYATKNHSAQFIPLDKNQSFIIKNFFLEEGEEIRFSYTDKKGTFKKPSMYVTFEITNKSDNIQTLIVQEKVIISKPKTANFDLPKNFFYDEFEDLDAVILEAERKKREKDPIVVNGTFTKITEEEYYRFPRITDLIQNNGYDVYEDYGQVRITSRKRLSLGQNPSPLVFVDDVPLTSLNILFNYSTANVEKILVDKSGLGYGVRGAGGVIKIYTRKTPLFEKGNTKIDVANVSIPPLAFQKAKEFYTPRYSSYLNSTFKKYGVISWIPEVTLTKNETTTIKIFDTRTKYITLFIEGISENGDLISQKKTIPVF